MAGNGTAVIVKSQSERSAYLSVCIKGRREGERKGKGGEEQCEAGRVKGKERKRERDTQQENKQLASFRCFLSIHSVRSYSGEERAT